ncbi:hypothetical protein ES703_14227 [subsurface metagenome]
MNFEAIIYTTNDGRRVRLSEPDDHVLELEIEGQVIARFSQTGVTIDNILKEVKDIGRRN